VRTIAEPPTPYIHFAVSQARSPWVILARTDGDAAVLAAMIRRELLTLEPNLLFSEPGQTLQEQVEVALGPTNLAALSMSVFGAVAMLLTAVGLYGVIAFLVALRTPEIGVRLALGASPSGILRMVVGRCLLLTAIGLLLGTPLALGGGRLLSFALHGVTPFDLIAWIAAVALIAISALLSSAAPAHRASRVDPMAALRCE
jgi:putative ABC transport system permease protein